MNKVRPIIGLVLLFSLSCCSPKKAEEAPAADSTAVEMVSSSAAVVNKNDSSHKFIRTADLKFRVKSVIKSTYDIETIVARQGGFVTHTSLNSNVEESKTTTLNIGADSLLETTHYTVINEIVLRVPNVKLDTTLKEISRNIEFLDYRIINSDDVALKLLSNDLQIKRSARSEDRVTRAIDTRGKKLNETTVAEEALLNKREQADNARIANLSLKDQINYSTVNLTIYQRQTVKNELIANEDSIGKYKPGFGIKLLNSLRFGWTILEGFILFIFNLWGLILLGAGAYFLYKIYKIRKHKNNQPS